MNEPLWGWSPSTGLVHRAGLDSKTVDPQVRRRVEPEPNPQDVGRARPESGEGMTDTEVTADTEPITDLSQVRWTTRHYTPDNWAADVEPMGGWHVVGEIGHDPDPHVREVYDLWVQNAHGGDGGDCSAWLADMVARKLTESDTGARWQRDRAVEEVNRTRAAMCRAQSALARVNGVFPQDQEDIEQARAALAAVLRNPS